MLVSVIEGLAVRVPKQGISARLRTPRFIEGFLKDEGCRSVRRTTPNLPPANGAGRPAEFRRRERPDTVLCVVAFPFPFSRTGHASVWTESGKDQLYLKAR